MKTFAGPRLCASLVAICFAAVDIAARPADQPPHRAAIHPPAPDKRAAPVAASELSCGDVLGFQVLLDKAGFSPGEIDGTTGPNLTRAISALQHARALATSGQPDCDTWQSLGGNDSSAATVSYTITDADVKGPFVATIPDDLV